MKIMQVIDSLAVGGAERHVVDLALALCDEGHSVMVACSASGPLADHLAGSDVIVQPLLDRTIKRSISPHFAWALRTLLRRERPDLVHAHMYASEVATALAVFGTGVPLVVTEHSEAHWQGRSQQRMNRWAVSRANHAIAVSHGIQQRLVSGFQIPPTRVSLIPNAVASPSEVDQRSVLPLELYRHAGPLVGVVARLIPEKGHSVFLDAVQRIAPQIPDARFVIVGDGRLRSALQNQARRQGIESRVHFLDEVAGARALIASFDLLVVPSLHEGTPLVVLEALSAGIPVIASRVGGIPQQILHQRDGLLAPPGDAPALAEAIAAVLLDPVLYLRLRQGAGAHMRTHTYENMLRRVIATYNVVLGDQTLPGVQPASRLDCPCP